MITKDFINSIYDLIIDDKELTTKKLNEIGFTSKDLTKLIEQGILKRVKRGYYELTSLEQLYQYGRELTQQKQDQKAYCCFFKCYELDSMNMKVCFQLFTLNVFKSDFNAAFEYLKELEHVTKYLNNTLNLYLYLLNKIIKLPKEYEKKADRFKLSNIQLVSVSANDINNKERKKIISNIYHNEFELAYRIILNGKQNIYDIITHKLLKKIVFEQRKLMSLFTEYLKIENYNEAKKIIDQCAMNDKNQLLSDMLNELQKIIETKTIPEQLDFKTPHLYEAIADQDYKLALSIYEKRISEHDNGMLESPIYLLLEALVKEIDKVSKLDEEDFLMCKDKKESDLLFGGLINLLMHRDFDSFFSYLNDYLKISNNTQYEFLIRNMVLIDRVEKNISFSKTIKILHELEDSNFTLNLDEYIKIFESCIENKQFSSARIYLNIISYVSKIDGNISIINKLRQLLFKSEKENYVVNIYNTLAEPTIDEKDMTTLERFINNKYKEIQKKGIIILESMSKEQREHIKLIVQQFPDMVAFGLGIDEPKPLVLRYKPRGKSDLNDVKSISIDANSLFKQKQYKEAILKYKEFMSAVHRPRAYIYARMGLAYLYTNNIDYAIDYLIVADGTSKEEKNDFNFNELICDLKNNKKRRNVNITSSSDDIYHLDYYYGIDNIGTIAELIANGIDINKACEQFYLNEEQKLIVMLILARECYIQEFYELGDKYCKVVERSKNKTDLIKDMLVKIRTNKKFFVNRVVDNQKRLVLLPQSKK